MSATFDAAAESFRRGEFLTVVRHAPQSRRERQALEAGYRSVLAQSLAHVGELEEAEYLARFDADNSSNPNTKSRAHSALAVVSRRRGDLVTARRQAQIAVQAAVEGATAEQRAWATVQAFRLLIDVSPADNALASLPEVKKALAADGVVQATAYLHICVAVLEGQLGRIDEARRHCDIADSLLSSSPNAFLAAGVWLNRGSLACLNCEFIAGLQYLSRAKREANRTGDVYLKVGIDATLAYVQHLRGDFDGAKATLSALLRTKNVATPWLIGVSETLARAHLALGEFDDSERFLLDAKAIVASLDQTALTYHSRWFVLTEARLALRRGEWTTASGLAAAAESRYHDIGDQPFIASTHLVRAQALAAAGARNEAARAWLQAGQRASGTRQLQAEAYYTASILAAGDCRS